MLKSKRWDDKSDGWGVSVNYCLPGLQLGLWHCPLQDPHREAAAIEAEWVDSKVDPKLAEQPSPECRGQWCKV